MFSMREENVLEYKMNIVTKKNETYVVSSSSVVLLLSDYGVYRINTCHTIK